jgi:hypothetical protein
MSLRPETGPTALEAAHFSLPSSSGTLQPYKEVYKGMLKEAKQLKSTASFITPSILFEHADNIQPGTLTSFQQTPPQTF